MSIKSFPGGHKLDWGGLENVPSLVKTINGETPDENGNVVISIPDSFQNAIPTDVRRAILTLFENAAYANENDRSAEIALISDWAGMTVTAITLSSTTLSFDGVDTVNLTATLTPYNSSSVVAWHSTDESVAIVDDGAVTSVGNGTCDIIASVGNVSAMCSVEVSGVRKMYSVTNTLINAVNSNQAVFVEEGASYVATITANSGYTLTECNVTMGGVAQEAADGDISISAVTGDIVVSAVAVAVETGGEFLTVSGYSYAQINSDGNYVETETNRDITLDDWYSADDLRNVYLDFSTMANASNIEVIRYCEYSAQKQIIKRTVYNSGNAVGEQCSFDAESLLRPVFDANTAYVRFSITFKVGLSDMTTGDIKIAKRAPDNMLVFEMGDLDSTTGEEIDSKARRRTDFVEVGETISVKHCDMYYAFRCYDADKQFVGTLSNNGATFTSSIDDKPLPTNTAFVRMFVQLGSKAGNLCQAVKIDNMIYGYVYA